MTCRIFGLITLDVVDWRLSVGGPTVCGGDTVIEEFGARMPEQAVDNLGRPLAMHRYDAAAVPATPARELRYHHRFKLWRSLRELMHSGELIWSLTMRSFISSYKQEALGVGWAVIQPLLSMVVLLFLFHKVGKANTFGANAALFTYVGVLAWNFFSNNCDAGVGALIGNMTLLNKVHCPREVFPISSVAATGITTIIQSAVLVILFAIFRVMPSGTIVWAPILIVMMIFLTIGVSIMLSVLVVYFRDLRRIEPMVVQFGLFVTPVGFALNDPKFKIPHSWWGAISFINPMVPIIDGLRRCILFDQQPRWGLVGIGAISTAIYFFGGYILFKKIETGIADVA
ncbi:MAG: ABC-type polysaccharide/polyol phosphate export system, permease component [Actinomycetia bacterium]|nr:ABC-type polysaccharide/polyol phosphate export system, permease component [Actinomycetes bacterium]